MRALGVFALISSAAAVTVCVVEDPSAPSGVRAVNGACGSSTAALAYGSYVDSANSTGWDVLDITANSSAPATLASFAAGFAEGYLTVSVSEMYASNTGALDANSKKLQKFLDENLAWTDAQVSANPTDSYWAAVGSVLAQMRGLSAGNAAAGGSLTFSDVYNAIIQGGDIFNLAAVYGASDAQISRGSIAARAAAGRYDHCSALVRLTPGNADIAIAHTTWSGFENMQRILKRYDIDAAAPGRFVALSGYPLLMQYSSDDFYVLSSGLVALETTIDNDNITLAQEFASTEVVLEWLRNVVANRLATDGPSWATIFSKYASGTYTNSWMIVDTNIFSPGSPPPPNTLTVVEEMPGNIRVHDRTPELVAGSWPSFNVPSDPYIFKISGQQALVDKYGGITSVGAFFSFTNTSRRRIFDRGAPSVSDNLSMRAMIRYNEFTTDPLSTLGCGTNPPYSATNAIADRSDLNERGGDYVLADELGFGDSAGIDAKVTLASWVKRASTVDGKLPFEAQSGPTITTSCPAFEWSTSKLDKKVPHTGQVDKWEFDWVTSPFE